MPLLVGAPLPTPEPPPPGLPPKSPPWLTQQFEFILSRGGVSLRLPCMRVPDSPWWVGDGIEGLDAPEMRLVIDRAAGMWGGLTRDIDVPPRNVFLPLGLITGDLTSMLNERDTFDQLTTPLNLDPVRLTLVRPDGTRRWVEGNVEGQPRRWDEATFTVSRGRLRFGLSIICDDPWWHGEQDSVSWGGSAPRGGFFPLLPAKLRSDRVLGGPTPVFVRGNVAMWPRFTVAGPATSVTATHVESGRSWTVTGSLASGQQLVVDTDPRVAMTTGLQVSTPEGVSRWSWLQPPFDLWPLPPGNQTITLTVVGASPSTLVTMEPRPNFRAA